MSSSTCSLMAVTTRSMFFPPLQLAVPARHGRRELLGAGTGHVLPPLVGFLSESGKSWSQSSARGRRAARGHGFQIGGRIGCPKTRHSRPPPKKWESGKSGGFLRFSAEQMWEMVFRVSHFASPGRGGFLRNFPLSHFFLREPD